MIDTVNVSYGPQVDAILRPDKDSWVNLIPERIISVKLSSGFVAQIRLPVEVTSRDLDQVIEELRR